ncbi:MAG: FIG004453: protein YceG like [uncultured Rubrobacteraceae bacterium]|uniref:Endolytic murein transglycosylase n=1 Tax=uncultured Rubrobacteraceae bacterium TaxID=349277 RepID=A0A6J4U5V6_9ACTN|nr:MAG: FIG004453: protein YceG like [uncultured Rubrobacteraceae bacterium]
MDPTVLGLILLAGVAAAVYFIYTSAVAGGADEAGRPASVEVVKGDTLSTVAAKLERAGVIKSALVFKVEARVEGNSDTGIKTGKYTFDPGTDTNAILTKLTAGRAVPSVSVTLPEGLTLPETARAVAEGTGIPAGEFESAARRTDYGYAFLEDEAIETTEGYLFPRRYDFEEGVTAPQVVDRMLGQYLIETEGLDIAGAKGRLNLTEHELVTVASLIEKESANAGERPVIASVIYNRIRRDMPLQIDATIQYALKRPKESLSYADLKVNSPYNTYENTGLPPGPICSPSLQSLQAAMDPARTDNLYYVLKADGEEHFFTNDYDAFLRAKEAAGR